MEREREKERERERALISIILHRSKGTRQALNQIITSLLLSYRMVVSAEIPHSPTNTYMQTMFMPISVCLSLSCKLVYLQT